LRSFCTPLVYTGNRGSGVVEVLGTSVLSILCGHWRYTHIDAVRGDRLNPPLLGRIRTVSEDVVRGAMERMDELAGMKWLGKELRACVEPVLSQRWIMDVVVTVKTSTGIKKERRSAIIHPSPGDRVIPIIVTL
jgi:hypothetical protein